MLQFLNVSKALLDAQRGESCFWLVQPTLADYLCQPNHSLEGREGDSITEYFNVTTIAHCLPNNMDSQNEEDSKQNAGAIVCIYTIT